MSKRKSLLEWQILDNQKPWPPTEDMKLAAASHYNPYRRYRRAGVLTLLLLLATAAGWVWHTAEAGLDQIEGEVGDAVQLELETVAQGLDPWTASQATRPMSLAWKSQLERELDILQMALPSDILGSQLTTDLRMIHLQDDLASAKFVTTAKDATQAYRQTRFYRNTAEGWQRTQPNADLWGSLRQLESSHFIFHFRQNDAQVVAAVAPQLDALYTELQRNFGLTPNVEKLVIEVTVEQVTGAVAMIRWPREPLVVPSPALYLAPVELSDAAILAQSLALPLIEYMGRRAIEIHTIPFEWRPLLRGLHLWQLWDLEMPLAHWRHEIVTWLHSDVLTADPKRQSRLPESYTEFCAMHSLWMLSPALVGIPIRCTSSEPVSWVQSRRLAYLPRTQLYQLNIPQTDWEQLYDIEENFFYRSHKMVSVATLVEYAVATYGYEQMPVLLSSLAHYNDWNTLIPAVYGVSTSEFEEGWQEYLVKEYGVQP